MNVEVRHFDFRLPWAVFLEGIINLSHDWQGTRPKRSIMVSLRDNGQPIAPLRFSGNQQFNSTLLHVVGIHHAFEVIGSCEYTRVAPSLGFPLHSSYSVVRPQFLQLVRCNLQTQLYRHRFPVCRERSEGTHTVSRKLVKAFWMWGLCSSVAVRLFPSI